MIVDCLVKYHVKIVGKLVELEDRESLLEQRRIGNKSIYATLEIWSDDGHKIKSTDAFIPESCKRYTIDFNGHEWSFCFLNYTSDYRYSLFPKPSKIEL